MSKVCESPSRGHRLLAVANAGVHVFLVPRERQIRVFKPAPVKPPRLAGSSRLCVRLHGLLQSLWRCSRGALVGLLLGLPLGVGQPFAAITLIIALMMMKKSKPTPAEGINAPMASQTADSDPRQDLSPPAVDERLQLSQSSPACCISSSRHSAP